MKQLCILFLFFMFLENINAKKTTRSGDFVTFDISKIIQQKVEPMFLSEHAKTCSFVSLELTKMSPIKFIHQAYTTDSEIIVVTGEDCLLFDKLSGKFIRKIGNTGNGPNEYMMIISSAFDEKNEIIYILCGRNHRIVGYDLEGKPICHISLPDKTILFFGLIDSVTYAGAVLNSSGKQKVRLQIGDFKKKSIFKKNSVDYVPNYAFFTPNDMVVKVSEGRYVSTGSSISDFYVAFYHFNRRLYMKEAWNDTIFQIQKSQKMLPRYVFNYGSLQKPEEIRRNNAHYIPYIEQIYPLETDNYLFFMFWYQNIRYSCVYEKNSKHVALVDKRGRGLYGIQNDLQGSIPFWPAYINQKGEMLTQINADSFYEYQKRSGVKLLPDLQEDDNPVIMIVK